MNKNKQHTSLLGYGYYNTITPSFIKRHILENPKWYTAYTPYQAEISQGRLESQYNYQLVIQELTGLPISNGSLLDEASAAGEAVNLSYAYYKEKRNKIIIDNNIHPQILEVIKTRCDILNIDINLIDIKNYNNSYLETNKNDICNIIFQYPNTLGDIYVPYDYIDYAKKNNILTTSITDLLALTNIISPGELGVNIALGNTQRFGIPLWYGGPHPAFFATSSELLRFIPGRIIGKSKDNNNNEGYRLALQTREQHIKKQKATSNICTSQSLLTNVVSFYSIYHGKQGLLNIYNDIYDKTYYFVKHIHIIPTYNIINNNFFDTVTIEVNDSDKIISELKKQHILVRNNNNNTITMSFDETINYNDIDNIIDIIRNVECESNYYYMYDRWFPYRINNKLIKPCYDLFDDTYKLSNKYKRNKDFFIQDIFNSLYTETELLRYINKLSNKDYTLCDGMIPLGSCTMKLNATYQLEPLTWDSVTNVHPYAPEEYAEGYKELINKTGEYLKTLTGFSDISFQSNSGAMGEYSGLLCIKDYHREMGDNERNLCLIPKSAHGTNFASASVANLNIESFDDDLFNNLNEFENFIKTKADILACMMITYPGTSGVFHKNITEINNIIHKYGGLVYMDGANMNALVGYFQPGNSGFDVCHLNLHKTFCIPHGGGGPGLGPILCNKLLEPYLPKNIIQTPEAYISNNRLANSFSYGNFLQNNPNISHQKKRTALKLFLDLAQDNSKDKQHTRSITASNWSSASLLTIPYLYISAMGIKGLQNATKGAILNANYLKQSLKDYYTIIDVNDNNMVAHEFIIDVSEFASVKITENDIAKRLMDYGFHPPTMSWPRKSVLMFEPTESESKEELDRLVNAMISIRSEIKEIQDNKVCLQNNLLKNAPHNTDSIINWQYPYSIEQAIYPDSSLKNNKFHIPIGRVNDVYGDTILLKENSNKH